MSELGDMLKHLAEEHIVEKVHCEKCIEHRRKLAEHEHEPICFSFNELMVAFMVGTVVMVVLIFLWSIVL